MISASFYSCEQNEYEPEFYDINTYESVDLGLSINWCNKNIKAKDSTSYGEYYAWGETESSVVYNFHTYRFSLGDSEKYFWKYCTDIKYDITPDNLTILESEDDVAHVKMKNKKINGEFRLKKNLKS